MFMQLLLFMCKGIGLSDVCTAISVRVLFEQLGDQVICMCDGEAGPGFAGAIHGYK